MDAYKAPEAELTTSKDLPFRPVKALSLGLLIIVVLGSVVSLVEGVVFAFILGANLADERSFEAALAGSHVFLMIDIVLTGLLLFWGGRITAKHVPGKEMKYGMILIAISLSIYTLFYVSIDSLSAYPMWYNVASYLVTVLGIYLGARSKVEKKKLEEV